MLFVPTTGKVLKSSCSFVPGTNDSLVFYRFVGHEVFYLITGRPAFMFSKICLYFPRIELIVGLLPLPLSVKQKFNEFKTCMVTNWENVKSYIFSNRDAKIVAQVNTDHFAHHLMNDLSGIYKLYEAGSLGKIDKFLAIAEPLGQIDKIFSEIPSEKIERIQRKNIFEEVLKNNYFVVTVGLNNVKEDLANRIYQASLKYCSSTFLAEVEKAKKSHFPLLWVTIRLHNRTWVSQIQGIANLIKKLSEKFPNLGVVIDGFSLPYGFSGNPSIEETINQEKDTVRAIQSLLPSGIKVYDTVGCMLYESIIWAYSIDLYLSHHGTIQHKVGWTANKPGVVPY